MTLPVSTEDVLEPQAATKNRSARRLNARIFLDMIFDLLIKQRPTHVTETRNCAVPEKRTATTRRTTALKRLDQKSEVSNISGIGIRRRAICPT
jgi:hypothetical protein